MVSRPASLPAGAGWSFEPKCDGFRAVISTERNIGSALGSGVRTSVVASGRSTTDRETPLPLETGGMLTVFAFDEQESRRAEDLPEALKGLDDGAMVWIALRDPTEGEVAAVQEALGLTDKQAQRLLEQPSQRRWWITASTCM
jgi:Mg2+ and Co2+ transporter CorA